VEPWELDKEKGDVILKYKPNQIEWLKKKGYLKTEKSEF
jgi:initiation factor 1A